MKCSKALQKAKISHKQVKKSKLSFTNHNIDRYSPKSPSWYESTSKGNNFFQHAYLCSNLSFCHKTGSCFQNIEKIFMGSIYDLFVIQFGLQTLSKLTKDIQQKTPKKSKNSHKQVKKITVHLTTNYDNFDCMYVCLYLSMHRQQ